MSWEFDGGERPEAAKDRTKLLWGGILAGIAIMAGLLVFTTRETKTAQSRVYVKHLYIECNRQDAADRDRALELVNDIRRRILSGDLTFEQAAKDYSAETASASKGGHLGWQIKPDFADGIAQEFAWEGPVGELSPVLESNFGFHLLFIEKRELSVGDQRNLEIREKVMGDGAEVPE